MASIVKRKKKYSVVYTYTDENGNKRQKWETFDTNGEAKKRKLEVEYAQEAGTFIPPSSKTVNDLLEEYMSIYGVNTWAMSTYESRKSLISNYIRPLIGDMKLEDVTPRIMDKYYRDLLTVKAVSTKYVKARNEYLTPHTIREIHKVLRNAFNQAVKWELMTRNPVEHATLPKEEHKTRDIWTAEVLLKALESCDDDILRLAINLAFSCSLRMGELLGLTWDCVDISPASIELGQASIFVEKELQRVNREAMADLNGKDILFKFPPTFASTHTALVLKTPKTKEQLRRLEFWRRFFENGTYERSWESGIEVNYDGIDGCVNHQKLDPGKSLKEIPEKPKKRRSVIRRLRKKQIEIAKKSGKPIPRYLEQQMVREKAQ